MEDLVSGCYECKHFHEFQTENGKSDGGEIHLNNTEKPQLAQEVPQLSGRRKSEGAPQGHISQEPRVIPAHRAVTSPAGAQLRCTQAAWWQ